MPSRRLSKRFWLRTIDISFLLSQLQSCFAAHNLSLLLTETFTLLSPISLHEGKSVFHLPFSHRSLALQSYQSTQNKGTVSIKRCIQLFPPILSYTALLCFTAGSGSFNTLKICIYQHSPQRQGSSQIFTTLTYTNSNQADPIAHCKLKKTKPSPTSPPRLTALLWAPAGPVLIHSSCSLDPAFSQLMLFQVSSY